MTFKRTHTCGELTAENIGQEVVLNGWVGPRRDLGGLIFIDLRDRYGVTQIVFTEEDQKVHAEAEKLRAEYIIGIKGKVIARGDENVNPKLVTGEIEIEVTELLVYSEADTPPFEIKDGIATNEETRLKYRYLDLRRPEMQDKLMMRSKAYHAIRSYYHAHNFAEVETPVLMKSTPEGARDYLVPSRVNPGKFFALPQSPQTYKQLLMVSGFDRYFQITKCFRDEDLRADRQPEFTQIDVEMSFVTEEDIYAHHEGLMKMIFKETIGVDIETPFPRMTYEDAMNTYGSDKPDTRFGLEFVDFSDIVKDAEFKVFSGTVANGGAVVGITIPGQGEMGRGAIDRWTERVKKETGAGGLIYIKMQEDGPLCSVAKFLTDEIVSKMVEASGAKTGDLVFLLAGPKPSVLEQLGQLRLMVGKEFDLINEEAYNLLWVTDFPLLEWDDETRRYHAMHHPFTSPKEEDMDKLDSDPAAVKARAYDLVMNGSEIGGGSIRIHSQSVQRKMFELLGIGEEEAEEKFGFLLDAFKYGAPPHGGIALGLDRIVMLLSGAGSLRDVIAFPKNQRAQSMMDNSPAEVDVEQLNELHIAIKQRNLK
ncbi:MAG TPA: aspartate--tRNA ligase [Balneolaceae bacterium]|nr:aspartate--tRNA ligase [Balneolaceae bacterium]|tara:strand:+ start:38249 stop:40024 length:1776 start_codon:yes stop_codon:yes gene_type:complete